MVRTHTRKGADPRKASSYSVRMEPTIDLVAVKQQRPTAAQHWNPFVQRIRQTVRDRFVERCRVLELQILSSFVRVEVWRLERMIGRLRRQRTHVARLTARLHAASDLRRNTIVGS